MTTRWDVERAVTHSKIPPLARLIVLILAIKADNKTGVVPPEHTPTLTALADMTGISRGSLAEWLKALDSAGWVTRVKPAKKGSKVERTSYALSVGIDDVVLMDRSLRVPRPRKSSETAAVEAPHPEPSGPRGGRDDGSPPIREADVTERPSNPRGGPSPVRDADSSGPRRGLALTSPPPTGEGTIKNHHGAQSANRKPNTAVASAPKWTEADRKPTTPTAVHGRTAALFPKPKPVAVETLTEAHQTIYRWLQANGFETLGIDEVRKIHNQLIVAHGNKLSPAYLRAVVSNGGAHGYAAEIKQARNAEVASLVADMQATLPPCGHGTPAGDQPHPTNGRLLCAQCRRGIPVAEAKSQTNPAVAAAVLAYRAAHSVDMPTTDIILTAQQAEAFLEVGATAEQVRELATVAGASGVTLMQAATGKDS